MQLALAECNIACSAYSMHVGSNPKSVSLHKIQKSLFVNSPSLSLSIKLNNFMRVFLSIVNPCSCNTNVKSENCTICLFRRVNSLKIVLALLYFASKVQITSLVTLMKLVSTRGLTNGLLTVFLNRDQSYCRFCLLTQPSLIRQSLIRFQAYLSYVV